MVLLIVGVLAAGMVIGSVAGWFIRGAPPEVMPPMPVDLGSIRPREVPRAVPAELVQLILDLDERVRHNAENAASDLHLMRDIMDRLEGVSAELESVREENAALCAAVADHDMARAQVARAMAAWPAGPTAYAPPDRREPVVDMVEGAPPSFLRRPLTESVERELSELMGLMQPQGAPA